MCYQWREQGISTGCTDKYLCKIYGRFWKLCFFVKVYSWVWSRRFKGLSSGSALLLKFWGLPGLSCATWQGRAPLPPHFCPLTHWAVMLGSDSALRFRFEKCGRGACGFPQEQSLKGLGGLAFRREASQVAFLVVGAGSRTVFPGQGRQLTVRCMTLRGGGHLEGEL